MRVRSPRGLGRHILLDLTPLRRSRDYRALITGLGVSVLGNQLTTVAVPFQVYAITRSSLVVGLVSLAPERATARLRRRLRGRTLGRALPGLDGALPGGARLDIAAMLAFGTRAAATALQAPGEPV